MNSTSPERIAIGALGNIAVAPGAIASMTRLRRVWKLVPLPFAFIVNNYAMARPLALVLLDRHLGEGDSVVLGCSRAPSPDARGLASTSPGGRGWTIREGRPAAPRPGSSRSGRFDPRGISRDRSSPR